MRVVPIAFAAILGCTAPGWAHSPGGRGPARQPDLGATPETSDKLGEEEGEPASISSLLGPADDPGGFRTFLKGKGVTYSLTYIGEVLGNTSGGLKRGPIYEGRLDVHIDADLDKLIGWNGGAFHTNFYQVHGEGLSRHHLGNVMPASGIEALTSTRLFELWFEQKLMDDKLAIRFGQLAADSEFLLSQYAALFVNGTFGWPAITGIHLPSGGPAYPLATPGIRITFWPNENFSVLAALFNGDPAGPTPGPFDPKIDPQRRNRSGSSFRLNDPPFFITEAAYTHGQGKDSPGLPGSIKFGGWHHFERFDDQRLDRFGLSLADQASSGIAQRLRGNDGLYAIVDQMLYRVPGTTDQGVGAFVRVSGSPGDRNPINFYADAGLTYKGLLPGRPNDTFGVGVGYAQISGRARALDLDTIAFTGAPQPIRLSETLIELTYQAELRPGWTLQPDLQYVFRPGGNVPNPRDLYGRAIKDAAVFGVRTTLRY